ncbi:MAG: hypothetical protein M3141_09900, partial [Actinomycetota bacterium]|nr:hypothetical protein [Actinomycetota bacterium]
MTVRYTAFVLAVLIACGAVIVRAYDVGGGEGVDGTPAAQAGSEPPAPYATARSRVRLRPRFKHAPRAALLW